MVLFPLGKIRQHRAVIEILLDPEGLKAAYGDGPATPYKHMEGNHSSYIVPTQYEYVADRILNAWLSKSEGNAEAAIKTAIDLLPQNREA